MICHDHCPFQYLNLKITGAEVLRGLTSAQAMASTPQYEVTQYQKQEPDTDS